MGYYISGYFLRYLEARKLGKHLGVGVGENTFFNCIYLDNVFNDWLVNHGKLNVKSAHVTSPLEGRPPGIMFITNFRRQKPAPGEDIEREEDLEVKQWLLESGVELIYLSFWDVRGTITLDGTEPRRHYKEGMDPPPVTAYYDLGDSADKDVVCPEDVEPTYPFANLYKEEIAHNSDTV